MGSLVKMTILEVRGPVFLIYVDDLCGLAFAWRQGSSAMHEPIRNFVSIVHDMYTHTFEIGSFAQIVE